MEKNIFQPYIDTIDSALRTGKQRGDITKGFSDYLNESGPSAIGATVKNQLKFTKEKDKELFESLSSLGILSGVNARPYEKLGAHPDFAHIKVTGSNEEHYIVSMFIDIKNSTGLFKQYYPETVAYVTTAIQRLAIHTCWYFGGYVQRLHGDGLLAYFGGKNMSKSQACEFAVNAASVFSYFIKYDLKRAFDQVGVNNISTRIGIDVGDAKDVLWHLAGIEECSEVTTCSLHTSLAYKMQNSATLNGIIVGDNVKDSWVNADQKLFAHTKYKSDEGESAYIYEIPAENFKYRQWSFDWYKHLLTLKNVIEENGRLHFNHTSAQPPTVNIHTPNSGDLAALERLASQNTPWWNS